MIENRRVHFDTRVNWIKPTHYIQNVVHKIYTWDYANMCATDSKFNADTKCSNANDSLKN